MVAPWGGYRDGAGRKPMSREAKQARRARRAAVAAEVERRLKSEQPQPAPMAAANARRAPMSKEAKRQRRERTGKSITTTVAAEPRRVLGFEEVAQIMRESQRHARRQVPVNPFQLPAFPPKAIPKDKKLAMDDAVVEWPTVQFNNAVAAGSYIEGQQFLGFAVLAMMAQRPEYRTISEILATECTRKWIKFKTTSGAQEDGKVDKATQKQKLQKIADLEDFLDEIQCRLRYKESAEQDGYFGRAHLFHDFSGGKEINIDSEELKTSIGSGRDEITKAKITKGLPMRLQTVEAQWVYPLSYNATNPLSPDWYNPQYWYVLGTQVHASRIPLFVGRPVPDMLKPAYAFGGLSMTQIVKPYVDIWLQTRESVASLIHSFSVMVLKTNMSNLMQPGGPEALAMRAALFNTMRDNQGLFVCSNSDEDFANVSAPLGGLHELQAQAQEHMFSVSRIPAVKFAGIQPTGLNASSEGEIRVFYDTIGAYQQVFMRPNLTRTIDFAQMVLWGEVDNDIVFDFEPLWEQTEKEKADSRKADADADSIYIGDGVIAPEEVRERLANDQDSLYQGIDPDDVPEPPEQPGEGEDPFGGGGEEDDGGEPGPGNEKEPGAATDAVIPFALDAEWSESEHPRAPDGKFGSGGGSSKGATKQTITAPQYGMKGGRFTAKGESEAGEDPYGAEFFQKNWHKSGSVGGHSQPTEKQVKAYHEAWENQGGGATEKPPVKLKGLKQVGHQMGSNPGGVFETPEGEKLYIKQARSLDHARNELAAADLYALAGAPTLKYRDVEGGKHIATEMAKLDKKRAADLSASERKAASADFVTHAWLGNWDAVGTGGDNVGTVGGVPTSLDLGGALEYRAQGAPKGKTFGTSVGELKTMRDPSMSPDAAKLYKDISPEDMKASAQKVTSIHDDKIKAVIDARGLPPELADKLIARKRDIAKTLGIAHDEAPFEESKHPRDPEGKFSTSGSSGGGGGEAEQYSEANTSKWEWSGAHTPEQFGIHYEAAKAAGNEKLAGMIKQYNPTLAQKWEAGAPAPAFKTKKEQAAHLLSKGTTTQEMLSALKWPSISMPQMAKTLGMKLEKFKEGGVTKYKGTPMTPAELQAAKAEMAAAKAAKGEKNAPAASPAPAAPAPKAAEPAKAAPAALPMPTESELAKAKKSAPLQLQYLGIPDAPNTPAVQAALKEFNDKYAGKEMTSQPALVQKVHDYKALQAKVTGMLSAEKQKQVKAQQEAYAQAQAKAKADADAFKKSLADPAMKAHADVLAEIAGGAKDLIQHAQNKLTIAGLQGKISAPEAAQIVAYTGSHYVGVNQQLREGAMTETQAKYAYALQSAIMKLPPKPGKSMRGTTLPVSVAKLYQPGVIIEERAFTSTGVGKKFSGPHTFEIHGKSGRDVSPLSSHPSEKEVLFPMGTRFKILSRSGNHIVMEEIDYGFK